MHSGDVTFLFTDVEGSTKLAQTYPDLYLQILSRHDRLLEEIITKHGGFVFKKVGDSLCSSFSDVENAVRAAVEVQKELMKPVLDEIKVKVRIGIHKGEAQYANEDYIGYVTLSRVQRIMSIAHGGQILISKEIYERILHKNTGLIYRDFGLRKLKDIIIPEHLYQISAEGMQQEFPPLRATDARENNLPSQVTNFIGRKKEIDELKKIFQKTKLLSLIGPGGTGKTRLALHLMTDLMDEFENGVWVVELAPITDSEIIVKELCSIFNLKENPSVDGIETLKNFLKDKKMILLFDNSEHLLQKCGSVVKSILTYCTGLKIISTSREAFNILGEVIYRVPPLSFPKKFKNESLENLSEYESVKFFVDRAVSVNSNFQLTEGNAGTVAELCCHLDGIPLAIELAARRINVMSAEKILERLSDRFKLLTRGSSTALPKQKTLKAMIDWSYDLLSFKEQRLLQCLSVFQGGWTLEAAEEICRSESLEEFEILDLMNSLVDKSLIVYTEEDGNARYNMLETIKEYAFEKLIDKANLFQKEIDYYLKLTDYNVQSSNGITEFEWLNLIRPEIDNIRSCIQKGTSLSIDQSVALAINMFDYWHSKGDFTEGFETLNKVFESPIVKDELSTAKLLCKLGELNYYLGKHDMLEKFSIEALQIFRRLNNRTGIIESLKTIGIKYYIEGKEAEAEKTYDEALEMCTDEDFSLKANLLSGLSYIYSLQEDKTRCMEAKEEALRLYRLDKKINAEALTLLSISVTHTRGKVTDIQKAIQYSEESIAISKELDDHYLISLNLVHLGSINLIYLKDYKNAEYIFTEALHMIKDFGYLMSKFPLLIYMGTLYTVLNDTEKAESYFIDYLKHEKSAMNEYFLKDVFNGLAKIYFEQKKFRESVILLGVYDALSENKKYKSLLSGIYPMEIEKEELKKIVGEEKFEEYYGLGKAMSIDEARAMGVHGNSVTEKVLVS